MKRYAWVTLLVGFVILFLSGCIQNVDDENRTYLVTRVIDGDTIELDNGRKVRYLCIDTPEIRKKQAAGWIYSPEDLALEAKDFNDALVGGSRVRLEFDTEKEDKYGRWLAYVYTDNGLLANEEILREGYAILYCFMPNIKYYDTLLDGQNDARENARGLWGSAKTIIPGEAFVNAGKVAFVRGTVTDVRILGPKGIELIISGQNGGSMGASIQGRNIALFEKMGIDPVKDYMNKEVEIFGKIRLQDGAFILVTGPYQIELK